MAQCKHCGRSGVLLRTDQRGLCATCRADVQKRVSEERDRIKEALICVQYLKDSRDRQLHLQRAMNAVRVLSRYETLGFLHMTPNSQDLATMLEQRLQESQGAEEGPTATIPRVDEFQAQIDPHQPTPHTAHQVAADERRSSGRSPARLWVRLDSGVRARTEDVSPFGARLRIAHLQQPGSRLRCRLDSPRGSVATEGVVRWAQPAPKEGGHAQMGVQFPTPVVELEMYG